MKKIFAIGLLGLTLSGCEELSKPEKMMPVEGVQLRFLTELGNAKIYKFEYEGTVCFIYNEYDSAAMSCRWPERR